MGEKTIGVIVATLWEANPLIRALNLTNTEPNRYEKQFQNLNVILAISGIGQQSARHMALMLAHRDLSLLVSCGYGGALQPGIRAGDLAVDSSRSDASWVQFIKLLAEKQSLKLYEGIFLSDAKALATREEKRSAGAKTGALLVEMESQAIFEVCRDKKIPFGSIRAVSDPADQNLPLAAIAISPNGKLTAKFWRAFLSRPQEWVDIIRLSLSSKKANRSLQKILTAHFQD